MTKKMEKNYSIGDIVTIKVVGKMHRRMAMEYRNFESTGVDFPDITIYLGNFTPKTEGCQILDDRYFVKDNYFYCEDSYKIGRWKIEVSGFESASIVTRLHTNIVGSILQDQFICNFTLDPLIRFVMDRKGYSPVHAAAVSKDGRAYLFPAQSGAGKTTTAAYFTQEGFNFLGDDFVILHNGRVFSWLTPLNVFSYNLSPMVRKNMRGLDRTIIRLKNGLHKASRGYIKIFSKLNPKDAFATCDQSELKAIFFLLPKGKFTVSRMGKAELIRRLFINFEMESFPAFYRYVLEYSYAFPNSTLANLWQSYKSNLNRNLPDSLPIYRIDVPDKYSKETFDKIFKVVQEKG